MVTAQMRNASDVRGVGRRQLLRVGAWTAPTVVLGAMAPAAAASELSTGTIRFTHANAYELNDSHGIKGEVAIHYDWNSQNQAIDIRLKITVLDTVTGAITEVPGSPFRYSPVSPGSTTPNQVYQIADLVKGRRYTVQFRATAQELATGKSLAPIATDADFTIPGPDSYLRFNGTGAWYAASGIAGSTSVQYAASQKDPKADVTLSITVRDTVTGNVVSVPGSPWTYPSISPNNATPTQSFQITGLVRQRAYVVRFQADAQDQSGYQLPQISNEVSYTVL